ncbi:MAG TPA: hypothetical protein VJS30_05910 [Paraburkholderia sp.]|nr:hypothetical protein [Paraburkholderia sp.]
MGVQTTKWMRAPPPIEQMPDRRQKARKTQQLAAKASQPMEIPKGRRKPDDHDVAPRIWPCLADSNEFPNSPSNLLKLPRNHVELA